MAQREADSADGDWHQSDGVVAVAAPNRDPASSLRPEAAESPVTAEGNRYAASLLQIWLSPAFPVGGFAYSHGLEKAVENGWISDGETLEAWVTDLVEHGSLRNDLLLLAAAWRASCTADWTRLRDVADLAGALAPSRERHLEATQQGQSFISAIEAAWPSDAPTWAVAAGDALPVYCTAVGFTAAAHLIPIAQTLQAYSIAYASLLTSAAIRLGIVGQTDAQRVIATLLPRLCAAAGSAEIRTLDDLGGASWRSDIAAQQHETQTTRLFRS